LETGTYWKKDENGNKVYYFNYREIGDEFTTAKYLMNNNRLSSSHAHKLIRKIKELKVKKK
jgi:hypothetical protein